MPTPTEIRAARASSGLTQTAAGALIGAKLRTWQDWESGARNMPPVKFEMWLIKASPQGIADPSGPTQTPEPVETP